MASIDDHDPSRQKDEMSPQSRELPSSRTESLGSTDAQPKDFIPGLDVRTSLPEDPKNWSTTKKLLVLSTLIPGCFLTDGVITYGTALFMQQAQDWHMSPQAVSQSISGAVFMQGPGGLLAVALSQRFGRWSTLFWSQFLLLIVSIGAAGSGNYAGFTACRTLQGFFGAAPQVIGLSMINDMFFFKARAATINVWAFTFLLGPYISPFISGLIASKLQWRDNMWVLVGFVAFSVVLIVVAGDETYFDRSSSPVRDTNTGLSRRLKNLTGYTGFRELSQNRPSILATQKEQYLLVIKPYVFLPCFGFIMPLTMWTIGLVNTVGLFVQPPPTAMPPGYGFSAIATALLFLAPIAGNLVAEAYGHVQNRLIQNTYLKRHNNSWAAETRLAGVYIPWVFAVVGLVLVGQAFQRHLPWIALAFGWGINMFGVLGTTTAISAYLLDILPSYGAYTAAWLLQARVLGGFTVTYFQIPWAMHNGPAVTFGIQAGIIGVAVFSVAATQVFGRAWRVKYPPPMVEGETVTDLDATEK